MATTTNDGSPKPAILSVSGNAAILVSSARRLTLLKPPELLTVNLAVTDISMALSMYPLSIASAFNHAWIGGNTSCLYYGLMGMIFSVASIMTLAVMGMVRYLVTGNPPKSGNKFQKRTITIVIGVIWLYAGLWALLPLLGWGSYGPEPFGLACSVNWTGYRESLNHATFIMTLSVLCTFVPCLLIIFTYSSIAWKLHRAYQSIQNNDFHYGNIERKITLMTVMISTGFIVAWAPYVVVSFWSMFHSQQQASLAPMVSLLPCLFAKSSTVYNPVIYYMFGPRSQRGFNFLQRPACCHSHQTTSPARRMQREGTACKESNSWSCGDEMNAEPHLGLMGNVVTDRQSTSETIISPC